MMDSKRAARSELVVRRVFERIKNEDPKVAIVALASVIARLTFMTVLPIDKVTDLVIEEYRALKQAYGKSKAFAKTITADVPWYRRIFARSGK